MSSCPTRYVRVARYSFAPSHCASNPPPGAKFFARSIHANTSPLSSAPRPIRDVPSQHSSIVSNASSAPVASNFPPCLASARAGAVLTCAPRAHVTPVFSHATRYANGAPNGRNSTFTTPPSLFVRCSLVVVVVVVGVVVSAVGIAAGCIVSDAFAASFASSLAVSRGGSARAVVVVTVSGLDSPEPIVARRRRRRRRLPPIASHRLAVWFLASLFAHTCV